MTDNIRYELDAPARKVRADLGLDPLEPEPCEPFDDLSRLTSAIVETERELTPDERERLRKEWRERMSGPNHGRTMILEEGEKFTTSTGPR